MLSNSVEECDLSWLFQSTLHRKLAGHTVVGHGVEEPCSWQVPQGMRCYCLVVVLLLWGPCVAIPLHAACWGPKSVGEC